MNKAGGIGVIIAVIIGIVIVSAAISMDSVEDTDSISEVVLEESIAIEEPEVEEEEGRDLSVELRESIGLKSP